MTVVYYVNTYFLDAALETIRAIKDHVDLHLIIELSPESKTSNIIDIDDLSSFDMNEHPQKVLGRRQWTLLKQNLRGVKQVRFIVFKHRRCFSFASFKVAYAAGRYIKKIKPDVLHFDSISPRILSLFAFLPKTKLFVTVHDPLPHTGEGSWKIKMCERLYFSNAKGAFFYSSFAALQFKKYYTKLNLRSDVLRFQPFSYLQSFRKQNLNTRKTVLFFGRIVMYKGVDILLEAIPAVLKKFPEQQFVIAGKPYKMELDKQMLDKFSDNITVIPEYIDTKKLAALISESKFIVCPYRDATQSGVLMTAYALGRMVVGTNVGAFPEYINNNYNGLLAMPNADDIAQNIMAALDNERYKFLESKLRTGYCEEVGEKNRDTLMNAYSS